MNAAVTGTVITVGGGPFVFSAAHAGLHDGEFESLHGHTFTVTLRVHGDPDGQGMVADFTTVKGALSTAIAPLRRRTLMPAAPASGQCERDGSQIVIRCGAKVYSLPAGDVVLLPVANTTTEAIAGYLLEQVAASMPGDRLRQVELTVSEAPDTSATVTTQAGPS